MKPFTRRLELLLLVERLGRVTVYVSAALTGSAVHLVAADLNRLTAEGWLEKSVSRHGDPCCLRSIYYLGEKSIKLRTFFKHED